jgi:hypothetical protein
MKKRKLSDIINEEVKKALTEAKWPTDNGKPTYWEVTNRFEVGAGAWRMTFSKGGIYKIEDTPAGQRMSFWDAIKNDWIARTPPISSYREKGTFDLDSWGYRGQGWVDDWMRNTTKLSQSQAESKAKAKEAVKVVSAREGAKLLAKLPGNQKVKITFIK